MDNCCVRCNCRLPLEPSLPAFGWLLSPQLEQPRLLPPSEAGAWGYSFFAESLPWIPRRFLRARFRRRLWRLLQIGDWDGWNENSRLPDGRARDGGLLSLRDEAADPRWIEELYRA